MSYGIQSAASELGIGQIVVLRLILEERIAGHDSLVAIAAGDTVADEFDGS